MTPSDFGELIKVAMSVASTVTIVVALRGLQLQRKIWISNHARSRAEKSIEIVRHFNASLQAESSATIHLVERLTKEQLKEMDEGRPFEIPISYLNDAKAALAGKNLEVVENEKVIKLTSEQSYQLRFQALEVLNAVEIVCLAWTQDVVDRDIVTCEMRFLYNRSQAKPTTLLQNFREVFHGDRDYPALYAFAKELDKNPAIILDTQLKVIAPTT